MGRDGNNGQRFFSGGLIHKPVAPVKDGVQKRRQIPAKTGMTEQIKSSDKETLPDDGRSTGGNAEDAGQQVSAPGGASGHCGGVGAGAAVRVAAMAGKSRR